MDHTSLSEVVVGLALRGPREKGLSANAVDPNKVAAPYNAILLDIRENFDTTELIAKHGFQPVNACIQAAELVSDKADVNWIQLLERSAVMADAGQRLKRLSHKMERGEDVDIGRILSILQNLHDDRMDFVALSEVEPEEQIWTPSHYAPLDHFVGGLPKGGLTIVGAPPGIGKTTLLIRMMVNAAKAGVKVGFFSMEMTLRQIAMRFIEVDGKMTKAQKKRILASEDVCAADEVYAKATRLVGANPDLGLIGIDFADLMVVGEQSEQIMGDIYKTMAVLAKRTGVPVVLLSQLSRRYEGGLPRVSHLRYSGMAEAVSSLVLLLWNPDNLWVDTGAGKATNPLPYIPGAAYIIVGKSRFGFKQGGVGAFAVPWDGELGWGSKPIGDWLPLPAGGTS